MAMDISIFKNNSLPVTIYVNNLQMIGTPLSPLNISAATQITFTVTNNFSQTTILTKTLTGGGVSIINGPTGLPTALTFTIGVNDLASINPGVYTYTVAVTLPGNTPVVLTNADGTTGSFTLLA